MIHLLIGGSTQASNLSESNSETPSAAMQSCRMAQHETGSNVLRLARRCARMNLSELSIPCRAPRSMRTFATPTHLPELRVGPQPGQYRPKVEKHPPPPTGAPNAALKTPPRVLTTLHSWPSLEPQRYSWYDAKYLGMPLRRDLLHRAVIYEGDATRRGTASTKHRSEVYGSKRKVLQQKGTGRARAGHKSSPIRKGGGVAHGPKPRDFSTGLQQKVYDKAWRTALSYRYRKDELKIVDDSIDLPAGAGTWFMNNFFQAWPWGQGHGRSLFVVDTLSDDFGEAMKNLGQHGLVKDIEDVDVKDLLEMGRIVIERKALDALLMAHSSDIALELSLDRAREYVQRDFDGNARLYANELNLLHP